jgi:GNAT superfamily N-acetyltransferase
MHGLDQESTWSGNQDGTVTVERPKHVRRLTSSERTAARLARAKAAYEAVINAQANILVADPERDAAVEPVARAVRDTWSTLAEAPRVRVSRSTGARVEVSEVISRRDRNDFVELPFQIYANDPHWVGDVKAFIDPAKHPFYLHGSAQAFVARRNGKVVGRVLVSDDPNYNVQHDTNLGCFGLFESIDDQQVTDALLDTAQAWLVSRGRTQIMGPIDYSTNYPCGLLVEGFDTPPRVMMNHQPAYYRGLLEAWGMQKAKDLFAWWFEDELNMLEHWRGRAKRLAARSGITIRPFRRDDFDAEVERCMEVYNQSWEKSWGFVKMTEAEFHHLANELRHLAEFDLLLLAEVDGRPIGFSMTLPDFNEALKPLHGRLTRYGLPIGLARFLWEKRRIRTARFAVLGILEAFRRRGVAELLILNTLDTGRNKLHYTGAELGWTLEDNDLINGAIEKVGGRRYKTYRLFERSI